MYQYAPRKFQFMWRILLHTQQNILRPCAVVDPTCVIHRAKESDTSPTYREFLMFHATLLMISTCFMHTLHHIYAFSGTNLLTRCRRASCCFLLFLVSEILVKKYSRNWTKSTPRFLFCPEASRTHENRQRGGTGPPNHRLARPRGGPRPPMVALPR